MTAKTLTKTNNRKSTKAKTNKKTKAKTTKTRKEDHFVSLMKKQVFDAVSGENGKLFDDQKPQMSLEQTAKFTRRYTWNIVTQSLLKAIQCVLGTDKEKTDRENEKQKERLLMEAKNWAIHYEHNMGRVNRQVNNIRAMARNLAKVDDCFRRGDYEKACKFANQASLYAENLTSLQHNLLIILWKKEFYPIFASRTDNLLTQIHLRYECEIWPALRTHSFTGESLGSFNGLLKKAHKNAKVSGNKWLVLEVQNKIKEVIRAYVSSAKDCSILQGKVFSLLREKAMEIATEISDDLFEEIISVFSSIRLEIESEISGNSILAGITISISEREPEKVAVSA